MLGIATRVPRTETGQAGNTFSTTRKMMKMLRVSCLKELLERRDTRNIFRHPCSCWRDVMPFLNRSLAELTDSSLAAARQQQPHSSPPLQPPACNKPAHWSSKLTFLSPGQSQASTNVLSLLFVLKRWAGAESLKMYLILAIKNVILIEQLTRTTFVPNEAIISGKIWSQNAFR